MPKRLDRGRISRAIHRQIILRTIPAGEVLDEVELADNLMVSRTPIREVVHLLAGKGLLVHENGTGYRTPVFGLREIRDFFDAASMLYPTTFARAAALRSEDDLAALRDCIQRIEAFHEPCSMLDRVMAYRDFNLGLVQAAQNTSLVRIMEQLIDHHIMLRIDFINTIPVRQHQAVIANNLDVYKELLALVEAQNEDGMRLAAGRRLNSSRNFVFAQLNPALS